MNEKEQLIHTATNLRLVIKGSETIVQLEKMIAKEMNRLHEIDDSVITEPDNEAEGWEEHNRLKSVYRNFKEQDPIKWDKQKEELLGKLKDSEPQAPEPEQDK